MEHDTGWILCGARARRKRKPRPFVKWVRSVKGLTVGYVSRMMRFDNSHSLWTRAAPKEPVKGRQPLQLSHDPLADSQRSEVCGVWALYQTRLKNQNWKRIRQASGISSSFGEEGINWEAESFKWTTSNSWQDQSRSIAQRGLDTSCTYTDVNHFWKSRAFIWQWPKTPQHRDSNFISQEENVKLWAPFTIQAVNSLQ